MGLVLFFSEPHEGKVFSTDVSGEKIKFCITGDTGMNTKIQRDVVEILRAEQCDRIVIVGDIIYPDGINSENDPQIKQKFEDFYYPLTLIDKKPKIALINGNHDYRGDFRAWIEVAKTRDWVIMPSRYYMEEVGGFCFYYMDSNIFLRVAQRWDIIPQVRWFYNTRKENSEICHKEIVFIHHPYLSEGRHGNAEGFLKWTYDWLFMGKSDFFISGHAHFAKDFGKNGKTHLLISGAGGDIEKNHQGGILILELGIEDHSLSYHFTSYTNLGDKQ